MLSNLTADDAADLIEHVANRRPTYSPMWRHWRGRIGMDDEAQARIWANIQRHLPPSTKFEGATAGVEPPPEKEAVRVPLTFRTFQGEKKVVQARIGDTLLQVGKEFDLPSLEGTCGGNCGEYNPTSPGAAPPNSLQNAQRATCTLTPGRRSALRTTTSSTCSARRSTTATARAASGARSRSRPS